MPQVRILSPRCDQKPDPNWYLSRPARGGFLLPTGTCAKAVPKSFHRFRWFGTTSPSVVDRDQHLQETWPEQSRNLRYTDPPSSCLHSSGFKTTRRLGTPLRSRRACRCLISGGDGKRLCTPHPDHVCHPPVAAVINDHRHACPDMQKERIRLVCCNTAKIVSRLGH